MTLRDYTANVISASKVVPDGAFQNSAASGVWDINEALDLIKGGNWPTTGNFDPATFVDGLFQCHLYDGTGSQQTITNNIDFTKGGLIITKRRDSSTGNGPYWNDTERGVTNYVRSDSDGGTGAQNTSSTGAVVSTSSTGYAVGTFNGWNNSSGEYVSWSFRKQPKFFDIVTYSGTGSNQNISHSLGSTPGMIIIKDTSASNAWTVYHRGVDSSAPEDYSLNLGSDAARDDATSYFNDTAPTSSVFTVGTTARTNNNGSTYVAYLFAHNADSTDSTQTSLQGKTLSNLGSAFDGSYPITEINDGVAETSNANSVGYVSNADMDISVDYGSAVVANAYYIAPQGDQGGSVYNTPTAFTAYGSNDGSSWTSLASFSSISGFAAGSFKEFTFSNTTAYRYYRLEITASSASGVSISEWELGLAPDASELGNFGEPGDSNIIKCDSYTGNGSSTGPVVNLGFEPQFIMIKRASGGTGDWDIYDNMRGIPMGAGEQRLEWNSTDAESTAGADRINLSSTGFSIATTNSNVNTNGDTYVYMAIRRGGMQTPTTASDVFAIDTSTSDSSGDVLASTFPVDMYLNARRDGGSHGIMARLTRTRLFTNTDSAEGALGSYVDFDRQTGIKRNALLGNASTVDYMWKRARGYFDVVTYTGNDTNRTISHNLGVAPEMMWVKDRGRTQNWAVYHANNTSEPATDRLRLNETGVTVDDNTYWNDTQPTSSVFSVGTDGDVNTSGENYIAYLFATVAGVSKVGSYTANGSAQNIDCGFTNGTKWVMIKRSSGTGNWFFIDTARGFVAGNDALLEFNSNSAEDSNYNDINPLNAGFTINAYGGTAPYLNINGETYIFYAIANDPS